MNAKENTNSHQEPKPERSQVVRLRKGQAHRLEEIGNALDTTQGQLVSWAIEALLRHYEAAGGKLLLPLEFVSEASKKDSARGKAPPAPDTQVPPCPL